MTEDSIERLRRLVAIVQEAREQARDRSFRTRVLLDMTLLELEREIAQRRRTMDPYTGRF